MSLIIVHAHEQLYSKSMVNRPVIKSIERAGSSIKIIDQTLLPSKLEYLTIGNYKDVIAAIKTLQIRGAPAIGIAAAYGLAMAVAGSGKYDIDSLRGFAEEFKGSRPTAVNLSWAVDRVISKHLTEKPDNPETALSLLWREAEAIHDEDRQMCEKIGQNGAELIKDGDTIFTHCNTGALATGGIGTALGVIYMCHEQGKRIDVVASETRPVLQGARLTAWELKQAGIPVTLICDSAAGNLFRQGSIDHVVVGADRITRNGDVANKIGTYPVAVLADRHNIPFYVAAPTSTFDTSVESGDEIAIEERSADEVVRGFGILTAPADVKVYAPAFDITPAELVSYYITDQKVEKGGRAG